MTDLGVRGVQGVAGVQEWPKCHTLERINIPLLQNSTTPAPLARFESASQPEGIRILELLELLQLLELLFLPCGSLT